MPEKIQIVDQNDQPVGATRAIFSNRWTNSATGHADKVETNAMAAERELQEKIMISPEEFSPVMIEAFKLYYE